MVGHGQFNTDNTRTAVHPSPLARSKEEHTQIHKMGLSVVIMLPVAWISMSTIIHHPASGIRETLG